MTQALISLLIVTAAVAAPNEAGWPDSVVLFQAGFEADADTDFDTWPDGWTRRRAAGYPHYIEIEIAPGECVEGDRALEIRLNGGAAAVFSPPIGVVSDDSFVVEAYVATHELVHDQVQLSAIQLDHANQRVDVQSSLPFQSNDRWRKITLGPFVLRNEQVNTLVIELHVGPGKQQDLVGRVRLDAVRVWRLPRLSFATGRKLNLYSEGEAIDVQCRVSGLAPTQKELEFQLEDASGRVLREAAVPLEAIAVEDQDPPDAATDPVEKNDYTALWKLPPGNVGYYRVRATVAGSGGASHSGSTALLVIEPQPTRADARFTWALPHGNDGLTDTELLQLLAAAAVGHIKYPLWDNVSDPLKLKDRAEFIDQLVAQRIEVTGLLNRPPASVHVAQQSADSLKAATIFTSPAENWSASLEPILLRLGMRVPQWQLGDDHDRSFADYDKVAERLAAVSQQLAKAGPLVRTGTAWPWNLSLPDSSPAERIFLALDATPPLSAEELDAYLQASRGSPCQRWVDVTPLPRDEYSLEDRARDLFFRMVAAARHEATRISVADPFDPQRGLIDRNGAPSALFLPWRTTARHLSQMQYLGDLQLMGGSPNYVFGGDGHATLMVWNEQPVSEPLELNASATHSDLWGRTLDVQRGQGTSHIQVERLPSFVAGLNLPVTQWQIAARLTRETLPSIFGTAHEQAVALRNTFPQAVSGSLKIVAPETWQVTPSQFDLQLAAGESATLPLTVRLPYEATSGRHLVRLEFQIMADQHYTFTTYRWVEVGVEGVVVELHTRLDPSGELVVEQRLTNRSQEPIAFNCDLYAPNRRRARLLVRELADAERVDEFRLPRGQELLGATLWMQAEQVDGPHVLSYRFEARP